VEVFDPASTCGSSQSQSVSQSVSLGAEPHLGLFGFLLCSLGSAPTENTVSSQLLCCYRGIVISPLHRDCCFIVACVFIIFAGTCLPSCCLVMNGYSGPMSQCTYTEDYFSFHISKQLPTLNDLQNYYS
jgi:hypothetical protein